MIGQLNEVVAVPGNRPTVGRTGSIFRNWKFLAAVLVLGLVLLYPFERTVVPSKSVLVVTEDWRPVHDAHVRQHWQHYSLESEGHEQDLRTGEDGRATFPARVIRASVLRRILHPIWNIVRQGVHASFGVHTEVLELGEGTVRQETTKVEPHSEEIVFRRR